MNNLRPCYPPDVPIPVNCDPVDIGERLSFGRKGDEKSTEWLLKERGIEKKSDEKLPSLTAAFSGTEKRKRLPRVRWNNKDKKPLGAIAHPAVKETHDETELMAIQWQEKNPGLTRVRSCMDSGAVEHVASPTLAPSVKVEPSTANINGMCYSLANDEDLAVWGQKSFGVVTDDGVGKQATY